ncbi:phosphoribosyl-ATP diphosphatase [Xanthobacter dioxanivorans]|uniref:Phosphoribosyl-ATP pyrophosphatase n=1 Tax=Xanthobacter dioxanivorans TaxID=2528964 RepID=A0A974SJT2_9HYPH|nr:phosphoribosyl-ATP diphosphatase [Xanthobacter dioxanivorans]QRG07807.1 phosphoribosyl-ATP diphosphatase [Xanthobacter dioxanivorans]
MSDSFSLTDLEAIVAARAAADAGASYTRSLLDKGIGKCAQKLGEEAVETVIAAVSADREALVAETSDLLYHLLVVLKARGVSLAEVHAELARRTGQSGLAEKASRPAG